MVKTVFTIGLLFAFVAIAYSAATPAATTATAETAPVVEPIIEWGKCPQLAPTEEARKQKTDIIKACLADNPLAPSDQLNMEAVEKHREKLGECALNKENWFNADKTYKYDRAEEELKSKNIEASIKTKVLDQHKACRKEALEKFPAGTSVIQQVQYYQSCMDFHVAQLCNVKIMLPQ